MSYFVVRDTKHPEEDMKRNWSAPLGGTFTGEWGEGWDSEEEALDAEREYRDGEEPKSEYRFHPAYDCFVEVDYEGLGAFSLESETLEEALKEADEYEDDLACCTGSGDGHFFAEDVVSFHKIREGRYIFELK